MLEKYMIRAVIEKVYKDFTIKYNKKPGNLHSTCDLNRLASLYGVVNVRLYW